MSSASSNIVFDDIFVVNDIDREGKKFDRVHVGTVSRLYAHSNNYDMDMTLDYNKELFPLKKEQTISMALASSLSRNTGPTTSAEGTDAEDKDRDVWRPDRKGKGGIEEEYDYVMYGKVYKFDGGTNDIVGSNLPLA
ncbi:DNA-directed RNA polymerases I, II, and III subunit RPABC3 [Scleroderma yunnanense]